MHIVCVDDNILTLAVTGDLLRELGHEVIETPSAAEALEEIRRAGPAIDLLLTDIAMPEMDGMMLACRARISQPGLPVVYMTGRMVSPPTGDAVLMKPCSLGSLSAALDRIPPRDAAIRAALNRLH